jgi:hypothetical protein
MLFQRCANLQCRRPFQVNEFPGKKTNANDPDNVICPHCGHTETRWSNSVFLVHALTPEEEAEFNKDNPLR